MPFLTFEGIDGSGKSSLLAKLADFLRSRGLTVEVTREPGGSQLGAELREILLRTKGEAPVPKAELLIYQADRAQHVETKIKPLLAKGVWVLSDRFYDSSLAFQGAGRKIGKDAILWLNEFAADGIVPDLTVLTDCGVETAQARMRAREKTRRSESDRFENEKNDFHQRVREEFLKIAQSNAARFLILDSDKDGQTMLDLVVECLKKRGLL